MLPPEALEIARQVAQEAPRSTNYTPLALLFLIVSQLGVWLDKLLTYARARADRKQAEADEAVATLATARASTLAPAAPAGRPGNGSSAEAHREFILPHSLALERHSGDIATLKAAAEKLERDNREDHGKIFTKLDELKDILIEEESRT
jgi:hypothetical protein